MKSFFICLYLKFLNLQQLSQVIQIFNLLNYLIILIKAEMVQINNLHQDQVDHIN